jgi:hypothetical protein
MRTRTALTGRWCLKCGASIKLIDEDGKQSLRCDCPSMSYYTCEHTAPEGGPPPKEPAMVLPPRKPEQGETGETKTDIVERIRGRIHDAPMPTEHMLDDAAEEIERLRAQVAKLMIPMVLIPDQPLTPEQIEALRTKWAAQDEPVALVVPIER